MAQADIKSLRLIIQRRDDAPESGYRMIIYGNSDLHRHSDFDSAQSLLQAIGLAIPGFDVSRLSLNPSQQGHGSIVFADGMQLDCLQLGILGLQ